MKQMRFSPWLILVLAVVLVFAAGCDRPDPQVAIETPQPGNATPQLGAPTVAAQAVATEPAKSNAVEGATPTLPAVVIEATPAPGSAENPTEAATPVPPTPVPPQPTQVPQPTPVPQAQPTAQVNAQGNFVHTVQSGDTLFSIGRLYNVNPYSIAAANNIPYPYVIYPSQQLTIPSGTTPPGPTPQPPSGQCRFSHVVRPGENLYRISLAYGVPMATIAAANGIVNYNLIYAGQSLCIP